MSAPLTLVVLGSGGRLGAALARGAAQRGARVLGFTHADLDLACPDALGRTLAPLAFDALVNCAALTNVDFCETHPEAAFAVNAQAVRQIAEICDRKRARCIHISTDYVFDGTQQTPYAETDPARPLSIYGKSKRQGETGLLAVNPAFLAARVSWVFGPDRPSFIDQILRRARETADLQAIGDKWSLPTSTRDLVDWLHPLLREQPLGGLLHLTQSGQACTWQEYGQHALDCAAAAGMPLKGRTVGFQTLASMATFIAPRPIHTILGTEKFTRLTGIVPRPWREAVEEYVRELAAR
ncbi:MAG: dTDP-4-dehydrorhamnose reductase [Chthoniobacteraceae bacterium]|nr:dTDP-4-dehydrorhamnose reductase [Chthoniobacteraceae bacterium]